MTDEKMPASGGTCFILNEAKKALTEVGGVLGLFGDDPDEYFMADRNREAGKRGLDVTEIDCLVEERRAARLAKNWKRADEIRKILVEKNIVLQDTSTGTIWKIE
jgi:cysteinyl-tRNA synthetase